MSAVPHAMATPGIRWSPDRPERAAANEVLRDYCLWEYQPLTQPRGRLRGSNLLFHSFQVGDAAQLQEICHSIRQAIGDLRTVWGVKWQDGRLSWEFYFYDYKRLDRCVSVSRMIEVLAPYLDCQLEVNETRPYFMFSLDFDADRLGGGARQTLSAVHLYIGNIGCSVSSGLSYTLSRHGLYFDNLYYFFDAKREYDQVLQKVACSAHLDLPGLKVADVLWPEMTDCGVIVVANKREHDSVYYSRIRLEQLLYFMRRLAYPPELIAYIEANAGELDHQLFDVGMDYCMRDGQIEILKSSYYGIV